MRVDRILQELTATAEVMGQELSASALVMLAKYLEPHDDQTALKAIKRVRETRGKLTINYLVDALQAADGRPLADEAWAIAVMAMDETATVVWSNEISEAWGISKEVHQSGDNVGARMAFRAAYDRIIEKNRSLGALVKWSASIGHNKQDAADTLVAAVEQGRLSASYVAAILPSGQIEKMAALQGPSKISDFLRLKNTMPEPENCPVPPDVAKAKIAALRDMIASRKSSSGGG